MRGGKAFRLTDYLHCLLLPFVQKAAVLVDATAGNGWDSLFLAKNSPANAEIYCCDVQKGALDNTRLRLTEANLIDKCRLRLVDHKYLATCLPENIDVAMFNLGYCPGLKKTITTQTETTIVAVGEVCKRLVAGGMMAVVAYGGHREGADELTAVNNWFTNLPAEYAVFHTFLSGRVNTAPQLFVAVRGF